LSSPNNPFADANGNIFVAPGDHIPAIPNYRFKAGAKYKITDAWTLGADINVIGSQYLVGDQSNQIEPASTSPLGSQPALVISPVKERRALRTGTEPVQSALLYIRDLLPNRFISVPQLNRSSHLRSGNAVGRLCRHTWCVLAIGRNLQHGRLPALRMRQDGSLSVQRGLLIPQGTNIIASFKP
jgi:hypothetical protein